MGQVLTQWAHALKKYKERDGQIFLTSPQTQIGIQKNINLKTRPHVHDTSLLT